jgi:hypothetical protein
MAQKFLNGIAVTGTGSFTDQVTIPETPTADAHAASKKYVDDQVPTGVDVAKRIEISVKNISGGQLIKGTVVHAAPSASPPAGNVVEVIAADYDAEANMPAIGILNETLADDGEGVAVMMGAVSGIDTDDFTAGDELYVGADGALTNTKPQTAGQLIQKIAVCVKSHASNGLIKVFGAGRSNDVPLPLYIDNTNQRLGIRTSTPNSVLDVHGSSGQLFSVTDDLSGDLFSVSDISGMPILNVDSSGLITIDGNLNLGDSNKIQLGASQDLQIYHDGSNSYISEIGTGDLIISADNDLTFKDGSGNTMANMNASNSVELMYGNVKKFETASAGVIVTGNISAITTSGHAFMLGNSNNTTTADTSGFRLHQSSYTDGRYTHRFRKYDEGGGVPLYIDGSGSTANVFTALARFGTYTNEDKAFEVFGKAKATHFYGDGSNLTNVPVGAHNHDGDYIQDGGTTAIGNINTIGTESIKHRWNSATTGRPASSQTNEYGTVTTLTYDSSYATQLAWDIDQGNLYGRTLTLADDSGTWVKFAKDGDYVPASGGTFSGGVVNVNTGTNTNTLNVSRSGSNSTQVMKIGVTDTVATFNYIEDTSAEGNGNFGQYQFKLGGNDGESTLTALTITKDGVIVAGNLTVGGTTTTLNTETVEVEDNILQLNTTQGSPDTATATTSGISIYRGDGVAQASFIFDDADDTWDLTNNLTVAGDVISASFAVPSGASTGFLKADGSVDSTTYSGYTFGATDLTFSGADPGDIVWRNADGDEVHRIWSGSADYLTYRNDAGTAYELISAGSTSYNNSNWDTAYTHSQAAHAPSNAEANVYSTATELLTGLNTLTNPIFTNGLSKKNSRYQDGITSEYPLGHYTPGETLFEIDTTWSNAELQSYFDTPNVSWDEVANAPGGYAIYISGSNGVGGPYSSGFPMIPIDQDATYYQECWIKNATSSTMGHYMGSSDLEADRTAPNSGFGNPGSYGYWVMSNTNPGDTWTKVSGYITGHHASNTGAFETDATYFTPLALFNYTAPAAGTRACWISGWKVIRVDKVGDRIFQDDVQVKGKLEVHTLDTNTSSTTALVMNSNEVEKRTLGSRAFDSTSYLPLAGGTLTGALSGTSATFSGLGQFSSDIQIGAFGNNNGEFVLGQTIANKVFNYGAEIQPRDSSIQLVLGRNDGTSSDTGGIGADSVNAFHVYDTTSITKLFEVAQTSGNATFAGDVTVAGGDIILSGTGRIQGIDTVSANTDAANKLYVDNEVTNHNHDGRYLRTHSRLQDDFTTITSSGVHIWDVSEASDEPPGASDGILTIKFWDSSCCATAQFHDFHQNNLWITKRSGSTWQTDWAQVYSDEELGYRDLSSVTSATTTTTVASVAIASYTAAFFDYSIKNGANVRAGTVIATHDGTNVEFNETSTVDLGDTSDVTLSVDISSGNMRLRATTTSSTWTIKALIRAI